MKTLILSSLLNLIFLYLLTQIWRSKRDGLHSKRQTTSKEIGRNVYLRHLSDVTEFLDYLILCLEAGQPVPRAFQTASENLNFGLIKVQVEEVTFSFASGTSFSEAIEQGKLNGLVPEFDQILDTILLSSQMGTNLIPALESAVQNIRASLSAHVEELAGQASVKMLFPLTLFILPVIFILLGTGVIIDFLNVIHS